MCQEIVEQARQQYPFEAARVVHRVGRINPSEQIVLVGVASQHRRNAFDATQFIMDYLKTRATIWKKEVGTRGEHWVGLHNKDNTAVKRWSEQTK
jgi:molybdopterin synthase catalytic subunit